MRFTLTRDPVEFSTRARDYLESSIERNVLSTVLAGALDGRYGQALFAYGTNADGTVDFAALRTGGWNMLVSELDPERAGEFVALWLPEDPELPGVSGVPRSAQAVSAAWAERTGGSASRLRSEAMHTLETVVDPPRPASGRLRGPEPGERDLLVEWTAAFADEAMGSHPAAEVAAMVDERWDRDALHVWDDDGPVSLVSTSLEVAGVTRIGPVYTPPEHRGHGYASSAVAEASRRALAAGANRCMLFTDLANPTSNRIYASIGYRRIGDWEEIAFQS